MKLSLQSARILPIIPIATAGVIALFQTVAYLASYNIQQANYFSNHSVLHVAAPVLVLLLVAAGLAVACLLPKDELRKDALPAPLAPLSAALGFGAAVAVLLLSNFDDLTFPAIILLTVALISQILAATKARRSAITPLLGFAAVIGCILLDAIYYFDTSLEMNAPLKISVLVGLLPVMVFYTGELRYQLGKAMPRFYVMLCFWVIGVGALSALPLPIAAIAGVFNRTTSPARAAFLSARIYHPEYLAGACIILGTSITAAIRLWTLLRTKPTPEPATETEDHA